MNDRVNEPPAPSFGGNWSDRKLLALSKYLSAYTAALKEQPFSLVYIDAFAGSGNQNIPSQQYSPSLLAETEEAEAGEDEEQYRHGSPLIALKTNPSFDRFIFIDKNEQSLQTLQEQIANQCLENQSIDYLAGDANEKLDAICKQNWKNQRAVAFIDPFATGVKWETIKNIATTGAIDLWLLFPAMAVNRMLTKTGEISLKNQERLTECFGTDKWKEAFYTTSSEPTLFQDETSVVKVENFFAKLDQFFKKRLQNVFPGVSNNNLILQNSKESPIFFLYFACSNPKPKAFGLAIRIADHIIDTAQ